MLSSSWRRLFDAMAKESCWMYVFGGVEHQTGDSRNTRQPTLASFDFCIGKRIRRSQIAIKSTVWVSNLFLSTFFAVCRFSCLAPALLFTLFACWIDWEVLCFWIRHEHFVAFSRGASYTTLGCASLSASSTESATGSFFLTSDGPLNFQNHSLSLSLHLFLFSLQRFVRHERCSEAVGRVGAQESRCLLCFHALYVA